jgi:serine/threonine protein kinase
MENYEFLGNIGQGMSGKVYKARHKKENRFYAIKKLNFNEINEKERIAIQDEVNLLKQLKHPNIVTYKDSFFDSDNCLNIVMVFCEMGDMYTKIHKQKGEYFPEEQILLWIAQLCLALSYVHDKQILHRDIKTQNIFIQNEHTIRIGDFGIAKGYNQNQDLGGSLIGTPLYMAPEVYNSSKKYSFRSDIWSLGCCIFEMCNLKNAFEAKSWNAVFVKVNKGQRAQLNSRYSLDMKNLVDSMLSVNGKNRPTIASILEKPFMKPVVGNYISNFVENWKEWGGEEEQVGILREQAEKFCIFEINRINEIFGEKYTIKNDNKDQEALKDINENEKKNLIERRKEIENKLKELENKKKIILENRQRDRNNAKKNISTKIIHNNYKSGSLNKDKEKDKENNLKIRYNSLEKKIPINVVNNPKQLNNNNNINMNIKKSFNKKNLSRHHQNSDYKISGLNIFQDNKELIPNNNNNSSNSKKKGGRPLTSNKKDMRTEPNGSVGKELKERDEKKIKFDERKQLTKIIQEINKLKKEIEQIDNREVSLPQYNINFNNDKSFLNNDTLSGINLNNLNNDLINNAYMSNEEENKNINIIINNENINYKNSKNEEELIEHKQKIENLIKNPNELIMERIDFYKNRCINIIGKKVFQRAYEFLKSDKQNKIANKKIEYNVREKLMNILGKNNIGFWQMINQVLMLEDLLNKNKN